MKERAIITPGLIRQVQLMLAGGATGKEVAEITGTSEGTISRIKKAGFDYEQVQKNTEARRKPPRENLWPVEFIRQEMEKQEPEQLELQGGVDYQVKVIEELPGQIGMIGNGAAQGTNLLGISQLYAALDTIHRTSQTYRPGTSIRSGKWLLLLSAVTSTPRLCSTRNRR